MRCSLRRLTCVVKILLLLHLSAPAGVFDGERLREVLDRELHRAFGSRVKLLDVSFHLPGKIDYLRIERLSLSVREGHPRGSFHVYLVTDRGVRRITANLKLAWLCRFTVASRDIGRGERIHPRFLSIREEFRERCPGNTVRPGRELMNYVALRTIAEGEPLQKSLLRREPLIRRGEEVNLLLRRGNLEISMRGKALDPGFYGDTIRIRIPQTGKVLRGKVISEDRVVIR